MPWTMVLIASVIGLPLFFEVGIVLLIPVVLMVAKRGNYSLMRIGIPALAGLSVMHGLVPPHPGPLVAIDAVDANLGVTLALGVLIAIPTVIIAGPVLAASPAACVPGTAYYRRRLGPRTTLAERLSVALPHGGRAVI
ncbi:gluconate:H+ symporter [Streptomyces violaceorubidus]